MRRARFICFAAALLMAKTPSGDAATLTITADQTVYQVGELITLNISGNSMGVSDLVILGTIFFDDEVADHVSSEQQIVHRLWIPGELSSGPGFADAFKQIGPGDGPKDAQLEATVALRATSPGTLNYGWELADFFDFEVVDTPVGTVTIVPEPATAALVALGMVAFAFRRKNSRGVS